MWTTNYVHDALSTQIGSCQTHERWQNSQRSFLRLVLENAILGVPNYATEMCANEILENKRRLKKEKLNTANLVVVTVTNGLDP